MNAKPFRQGTMGRSEADSHSPRQSSTDSREVLFVFPSFAVGGTERHVLSLVRPLKERGWQVSVFVLSATGDLRPAFEQAGARILRSSASDSGYGSFDPRRLFRVVRDLFGHLRRRRPAVVHFFLTEAYLIGAPVALAARASVCLMSRRGLNTYRSVHPLLWRLERLLHPRMSAVLGNSRAVAVELRAEGVPADRLGLIYNGIDVAPFRQDTGKPEAKVALGLSPATLVMTIVANLIGYKGHADLFDALALARPRLPADWKLLVVGRDDGIGVALRERAAAGGIADNVVFLGPRKDVPALYAASDIGLLTSHEEGFSNAVLEGMAAGLPMIVTDVGGNPEAVLDGESGLVVPARNPQRLAEAIVRLASDPALRTRLGAAAAERIAQNFTIEQCAARYDALYRALTTGGALKDVPAVAVELR